MIVNRVIEFFTQSIDIYIDHRGVVVKMNVPNLFNDTGAAAGLSLMAQQQLKQGKLLAGKFYGSSALCHAVGIEVHFDIGVPEDMLCTGAVAQEHAYPSQQFFKGKRLAQVVVCAGFETEHYVVHRVFGRQENHGNCLVFLANGPAYLDTAHAGQHPVQQDQVVFLQVVECHVKPCFAVAGHIHCKAFFFQAFGYKIGNSGFIFYQ